MLETPHVIVGATIASKTPNPLISIPLALGSHFMLEKVPHWNPHLNTEFQKYGKITKSSTFIVIADSLTALFSGSFIAYKALPNAFHAVVILGACFASVLPDVIEAPYFFLKVRSSFIKKWIIFQKKIQSDTTPLLGIITQLVTILATLWWLAN